MNSQPRFLVMARTRTIRFNFSHSCVEARIAQGSKWEKSSKEEREPGYKGSISISKDQILTISAFDRRYIWTVDSTYVDNKFTMTWIASLCDSSFDAPDKINTGSAEAVVPTVHEDGDVFTTFESLVDVLMKSIESVCGGGLPESLKPVIMKYYRWRV